MLGWVSLFSLDLNWKPTVDSWVNLKKKKKKSLLMLCQKEQKDIFNHRSFFDCCFIYLFFGLCCAACRILALWPGIEPAYPAMEGEILTMGSPGKSLWLKISSTQANVPHFPPPLFHPLTLLWVRKLLRGYFKNRPLSVASWHASNFSHITAELKWKLATGNTLSLTLSAATSL